MNTSLALTGLALGAGLLLSGGRSAPQDYLIPDGVSRARKAVLRIALYEVGVYETSPDWSEFIARYNDFDYDPAAWCVRFVKWCFRDALSRGEIPEQPFSSLGGGGSTSRTKESAQELGIYFPVGTYVPRPADIGIMDGHTLLVLGTSCDGTEINTVEGNWSNRVRIGRRPVNRLLGFINVLDDPRRIARFRCAIYEGDPDVRFPTRIDA